MKKISCLIIVLFLFSCKSIALDLMGANEEKATLKPVPYKNKSIYFIGMHHVGLPTFYFDTKKKIDSLKKNGFTVIYEGLERFNKRLSEKEQDTYGMKLRKIIGFSLKTNRQNIEKSLSKKYIYQPSNKKIGIDSLTDVSGDTPLDELIDTYERENGKVQLSDCDKNTPFDAEYHCGKKNMKAMSKLLVDYRNQNLAKIIVKQENPKILIVFGSFHYVGVRKILDSLANK